jgi:cyclic beta-1,2-glucan synthetase
MLPSLPKVVLSSAATAVDLARTLASERDDAASAELLYWIEAAQRAITSHGRDLAPSAEETAHLDRRLREIEKSAQALANAMDFSFLFDRTRRLLSIGYLVTEDRLDTNCYDLLASEARLASFMAIAAGEIPARHWFRLGRGWQASWRSRRARSRHDTGSGWGGRPRRWDAAPPWSHGRARCSST